MVKKVIKTSKKINQRKNISNKELFSSHAILHAWWNNPERTNWTRTKIRKEHTRLVKIILKRGYKHNSPLK
jgi:competence transcription factor ComK